MEESFKEFEDQIYREHRFGWTPRFKTQTTTSLSKELFIAIAVKTFEKLNWDIVYIDEQSIEAKRMNDWDKWTEKITAKIEERVIHVESSSLNNEFLDWGRNSKRVKLFIYAFNTIEKQHDYESLKALEVQIEKEKNWDDYQVPGALPAPKKRLKPSLIIPSIVGLMIALLAGFMIAYLRYTGKYVILFFDIAAGILISFVFKNACKWGNYTNFRKIKYLIAALAFITFVSSLYFWYYQIESSKQYLSFTFFEFISGLLEAGIIINSFHVGWIGLVICWLIQILIYYYITVFSTSLSQIKFVVERVPSEVTDFTFYHFMKGKPEEQVRYELSKMGWSDPQAQEEAIESISGVFETQEFRRF